MTLSGFDGQNCFNANKKIVLIPLLVDDPLRVGLITLAAFALNNGLNPSFSGWPSPGLPDGRWAGKSYDVLIPLLVDDPLRAVPKNVQHGISYMS